MLGKIELKRTVAALALTRMDLIVELVKIFFYSIEKCV